MRGTTASGRSSDDTSALWRAFTKNRCPKAREQLIVHYLPIVRFVAGRVGAGMPRSVDHDDLVSYGTIGLIEAVDRFDLKRKVKFETYAVPRIRGAMLDEMRALDWVPRSVRARQRQLDRAASRLRSDLLREPTAGEIAADIGCDAPDARLRSIAIVALEELVALGGGEDGEYVTVLDTILDDTADEPGAGAEREETRRVLVDAMAELSDREYSMVAQYYFGHRTLSHIGRHFGVTESRVSQIHTKALRTLGCNERVRAFADPSGWALPRDAEVA